MYISCAFEHDPAEKSKDVLEHQGSKQSLLQRLREEVHSLQPPEVAELKRDAPLHLYFSMQKANMQSVPDKGALCQYTFSAPPV